MEVEREQVVQALCAHYAQDHLSTGELEARFDRVYKASSQQQLTTILEGLPVLPRSMAMQPLQAPLYQLAPVGGTAQLPAARPKRYAAFFSEVKKEGAWMPAPQLQVKCMFGAVRLDLREAQIPPEGITIDADCMFGEVKILLPPGIGAEMDATAILGSAVDKAQRGLPGAPMVIVRGSTICGEIRVETKLPRPQRMESWRAQLKSFFSGDE